MPFEGPTGEKLRKALLVAVILLGVFLGVEALAGLIGLRYIGAGIAATDTITVSGHGEILAIPNIATFTFSVVSDKTTVAAAQADAAAKVNAITSYLESSGVDGKDIQTTDYSVYPQYEYQQAVCPGTPPSSASSAVPNLAIYCPPGKQVLNGYEVSQTTTVKVRDTSKAGDLLSGVGSHGATQVSGLTFTLDNPTGVQAQARTAAINDAKAQAQALAGSLGVSLVRIVSFSENNAQQPSPVRFNAAAGAATASLAATPEISAGQNTVTDDVSITYEIR